MYSALWLWWPSWPCSPLLLSDYFKKRKSNKKWRPIVKNHFFFGVTPSHFSFHVHTGNNITKKKKKKTYKSRQGKKDSSSLFWKKMKHFLVRQRVKRYKNVQHSPASVSFQMISKDSRSTARNPNLFPMNVASTDGT